MNLSANSLKWVMRLYPPLFFNRVWVKKISRDFMSAEVRVSRSLINSNFNRSIFGGSIYCAADPFFSILLWSVLNKRGYSLQVWLKSASVHFVKPAFSSLSLTFALSQEHIRQAEEALNSEGKYVHSFPLEATDKDGAVCALFHTEVYARTLVKTSPKP